MGYKQFVSMNIAVIGSGETAGDYAGGFAFAGHQVFMATREGDNAVIDPLLENLSNITICSIGDAAAVADLIVIATAPKDVREVAYWLGDIRKKVIIDATANVHASDDELVNTVTGIQAITGSPHVVKVFTSRGYEQVLKPLFRRGVIDVMMAGDSKKAKEVTKIMALEMGMESFYDFGGNDALPLFNAMTKCWRAFALANPVNNYVRTHR